MSEHIGYLDGWRGLAIAFVLAAHFVGVPWMDAGRFGVDLFFVLSGFLMSRILYEKRTPLGEFYRRRISRVFPAFLAFVVIVFGFGATTGVQTSWSEFFSTLTFTRAYIGPPIWSTPMPTQNLWSLNVEEHSYVVLATLTLIPIARTSMLFALAGLTVFANVWWMRRGIPNYDLRTECAATALLLSAGYRTIAPKINVHAALPIAALILAAFCYTRYAHWAMKITLAPAALAFAVNHIQASKIATTFLNLSWLRQLGLWSFSLYLWQQPLYKAKGLLTAPGALALAVLVGILSFTMLEQPARRWLNEHWRPMPLSPLPQQE